MRWGGGAEAAGCDIKQAGRIWASVPLSTRARISPGITAVFRCAGKRLGRGTDLPGGAQVAAGATRSVGARQAGACMGAGHWQVGLRRGKGEGDAVWGAGLCASACWAARGVRLG